MSPFEVHSTRLFPKHRGAFAYLVSGIAARCDWVVLSDTKPPHTFVMRQVATDAPRHVFLSLRAPLLAWPFFLQEVLPTLRHPFVLVTGSEDATVPHQVDQRWRRFRPEEVEALRQLAADPRVLHWFAENLDAEFSEKVSPLPVGLVFDDHAASHVVADPGAPPLAQRPLRALCAHRVREGGQWEARREVSRLCAGPFASFCTVLEQEVPRAEFARALEAHAFVLCVEGGGLDPSPKAWQALLHGAIPVIRHSPLDAAYVQLPVAFVDAWNEDALSLQRLAAWREELGPRFDQPALRAQVLQRLGADYWWSQVAAKARPQE